VEAARHRGTHGGGAGTRHELGGGWGGGQRFIGVDPVAVREAVSEDPTTMEAVEERAGTWVAAKWRRIVALGFKGQPCD
jgi:hypothetical protein